MVALDIESGDRLEEVASGVSFALSWKHPEGDPGGRSTLWIHPSIPLRFVFDEPNPPQINMKWVEQLMHTSYSIGEITLVDEVLAASELETNAP